MQVIRSTSGNAEIEALENLESAEPSSAMSLQFMLVPELLAFGEVVAAPVEIRAIPLVLDLLAVG